MQRKKVSDEVVVESYRKTGNIWKTAEEVGLCGQSVYERLVKLGVNKKINKISDVDLKKIKEVYLSGIKRGDGKLKKLSEEINRTIPFISRKAKELGLTSYYREGTESYKKNASIRSKKLILKNGHPRGFLGHKHSEESKRKMSEHLKISFKNIPLEKTAQRVLKSMQTKIKKYGKYRWFNPRNKSSWKAAWRKVGSKEMFFRSRWEYNYAIYLQYLKKNKKIKKWEHEADVFWFHKIKRGVRSYLPDFKVTLNDGTVEYHEVKGWYDKPSQIKTKRMALYYPEVKLKMIFTKDYKEIEKKYSEILKGWEKVEKRVDKKE